MTCRHFSCGHLLENVPATWLQHPRDLVVQPPLVRDVHADVLDPDDVK